MRPTVLLPLPIMPTRYTLVPPSPAAARSAAACAERGRADGRELNERRAALLLDASSRPWLLQMELSR